MLHPLALLVLVPVVTGCRSPAPADAPPPTAATHIAAQAASLLRDLADRDRFQGAVVINRGDSVVFKAGYGFADRAAGQDKWATHDDAEIRTAWEQAMAELSQSRYRIILLFSGGLMLGAVYMATDMVTSPVTNRGRWAFGAGVGVLVVVIRVWGGLPEGVMCGILFMNALVPFINRTAQPRVFGIRLGSAQ